MGKWGSRVLFKSARGLGAVGFVLVLALAALAGTAGPAKAFVISQIGTSGGNPSGQPVYEVSGLIQGDSFGLTYSFSGSGFTLGADGMFTVSTLSSTQVILDVMITNTSTAGGGLTSAPITIFGIAAEGFTGLGSGATGGSNLAFAKTGNFPGFGDVDACAKSKDNNNCAGGDPQTGINFGESDTFQLILDGSFGSTLTLSQFAIKFQPNDPIESFELAGGPPTALSQPSTLFLFAAGLGLLVIGIGAPRVRGALARRL